MKIVLYPYEVNHGQNETINKSSTYHRFGVFYYKL